MKTLNSNRIDKIKTNINSLTNILSNIETMHPSDVSCAMGIYVSYLSDILDEIDLEQTFESNNYLTYSQFLEKLDDSDLFHMYYKFKEVNNPEHLRAEDFYKRNIKHINKHFVSNFK